MSTNFFRPGHEVLLFGKFPDVELCLIRLSSKLKSWNIYVQQKSGTFFTALYEFCFNNWITEINDLFIKLKMHL